MEREEGEMRRERGRRERKDGGRRQAVGKGGMRREARRSEDGDMKGDFHITREIHCNLRL